MLADTARGHRGEPLYTFVRLTFVSNLSPTPLILLINRGSDNQEELRRLGDEMVAIRGVDTFINVQSTSVRSGGAEQSSAEATWERESLHYYAWVILDPGFTRDDFVELLESLEQ